MGRRRSSNSNLWNAVLQNFEKSLDYGGVDCINIYKVMRALAAVNYLDEDTTKGLVNYLIKRGYDADDLLCMHGPEKKKQRKPIHLIMLISYSAPNIRNKHLKNLLVAYARAVIEAKLLNPMECFELYKALRNLKDFKADNLLK